jgi:GT2 family glycosyltransferase
MIDVTYGILNYNPDQNGDATKAYIAAVESLAQNRSDSFKSEVYLIDQGSQPDLTDVLARTWGFHAVTLRNNVGISRGINLLANMARGQYVSLVTSDVTFTPGLDDTLIAALRADPKIYQICPVSDNSSLDHQRAPCAREDGILLQNIVQELTIQFWPRSVFERIGYFDERWKACYENMDFALRAFLEGGSIVIHQGVWCHHEHNGTTKSGAIHHSYDGYLPMPDGLNHGPLLQMWRNKWPNLERYMNHYETFTKDMDPLRAAMFHAYSKNVYLPYVQEVAY